MMNTIISLIAAAVTFGTVLMYGTLGEVLTERSGNLNLGVEGIMFMGGAFGLGGVFYYEQAVGEANSSAAVALLIALARLPHMIGVRLLTAIPVVILAVSTYFFFNIWVIFAVLIYYIFFGFAFSRLIYASVANGFFDKFINSRIEGVEINRGLYKDDDDDDDEEDGEADGDDEEDDEDYAE